MGTRVLSGDAAPVESVPWKTVAHGAQSPGRPGGGDPPGLQAADGELELLRARVAQLEREAQQREQQAFASGYRKGEAAGQEQAAARLNPVVEQFARTVNELSQMRRKLRRDAEQDVVRLSLAIGRRVLNREMSIDPEAILGVVKAALEKLEGREVDRVRVNSEDAEVVKKHVERLGRGGRMEVVAEDHLARGTAVFETARGKLDASVETQLEEIERGLADRLRQWQ